MYVIFPSLISSISNSTRRILLPPAKSPRHPSSPATPRLPRHCISGCLADTSPSPKSLNRELQEYNVETAIAIIADGGATLAVDTQHLRLNLRVGSLYQFIGELSIQPSNEGILKARVGRNVDRMDLNLYQQSLNLLKQFQSDQISQLEQLQ